MKIYLVEAIKISWKRQTKIVKNLLPF